MQHIVLPKLRCGLSLLSLLASVRACAPVLQLFGQGVHLDYIWARLCPAFACPGWNNSLVRSGSKSF